MTKPGDYCSFTKAVEHLGDRWRLVIVRELQLHGPLGFNALAGTMAGISRSVLAARLRKLEDLEVIARDDATGLGGHRYRLTLAGRQLAPVIRRLWLWSTRFVPQDPAMAERDPDIVAAWLRARMVPAALPELPVVLDLDVEGTNKKRFWLVAGRRMKPSLCVEDPTLGADRYVYVEADVRALYPVSRGERSWSEAIADGSVRLFGDPGLVAEVPRWFRAEGDSGRRRR